MHITRRGFLGAAALTILSGCAKTRELVPFPIGGGGSFSFAVLSDLHIADARSASMPGRAVEAINRDDRVRFAVIVGDLTNAGTLSELKTAKSCMERLGVPWFAIPGNHDMDVTRPDIRATWRQTFGDSRWRREEEGWALLGVDTCDGTQSDVAIRPDEMAWLEKMARKINKKKPLAIFAHHPLGPTAPQYRVRNADEALALFAEHDLRVVACGHFHGNHTEQVGNTLFTTTACLSSARENHDGSTAKGYRLFHVKEGDVETEFVEVPA